MIEQWDVDFNCLCCKTSISKTLRIGQKFRCMKCKTKFVIYGCGDGWLIQRIMKNE